MAELPDDVYQDIKWLCGTGDNQCAAGKFKNALKAYEGALDLLPEPTEQWTAATWIYAAIADAHFLAGNYLACSEAAGIAIRCPDGLGNPFIHLRLGQSWFELGNHELAAAELTRAYMGGGRDVFENSDPKYLGFLSTRIVLDPSGL